MTGTPDLAAAVADPSSVPVAEIPAVIGALEAAKAILWGRLAAPTVQNGAGDHLLTIAQAAERLSVLEGWLKKRPDLPFRIVLSEGTVRYSARGIDEWLARRRGPTR